MSLAEASEDFKAKESPPCVGLRRAGQWWRREDSNLRHGAYETPALPPELRRRAGDRAANLQAYGAGVKRAEAVCEVTVFEIVPVSRRATS